MRSVTKFLTYAAAALVLAGCGSDNGSSSPAEVTGIWTGNFATRATGTLEIDFTRSGTNLTGTALLTLSGTVYTGSLTGTITNNQVSATVVYDQNYGTANYTITISGTSMTGSYTRGSESGNVSLDKNVGLQTSNIAGNFVGTSTQTGGSARSLNVTFTQNGDTFSGSYVSGSDPAVSFTGTIVGTTITYGVAKPSQGLTVTFNGTVSSDGKSMSGNYSITNGSQTATGTWTITKPS